jgi:hypothetical protein
MLNLPKVNFLGLDTNHLIQIGMVTIFILAVALWLNRIIVRSDNELDWVDLVAVHGQDEKYHADWTKIGQGAGVFVATFIPLQYAVGDKFEPGQGAILMGAALTYLGGVAGYSASLRAKIANGNGRPKDA